MNCIQTTALAGALALGPALCLAAGPYYIDKTAQLPISGISSGAAGPTMDVAAADLNGDGFTDLVLAHEFIANVLLFNDGTGRFTNVTAGRLPQAKQDSEDIAIADVDGDGDPDIIIVTEDDITQATGEYRQHEFYLNDGTGTFTPSPFALPDSEANAVAAGDVNGDGKPDIIIGNAGQNFLLFNDGKGGFTDGTITHLPEIYDITQDLKLADLDGDGDLDLIVGNEDRNRLLINNGQGVFTDESMDRLPQGVNMETRKVTVADVNGDGHPDLFFANVAWRPNKIVRNRLYINNGTGVFTDETATRLPEDNEFTLDGIFTDVDLDGDRDLITVNFQQLPYKAYRNDGTGVFTEATEEVFPAILTGAGLAVLPVDLNGDGIEDLYFGNRDRKDYLLMHTGTSTGMVEPLVPQPEQMHLFPNPCSETLVVQVPGAGISSVEVVSATGQRVYRSTPAATGLPDITVPVSGLPSGLYTVRIFTGTAWFTNKFIRE